MESVKRKLCPAEATTSSQLSDGWKSSELGSGIDVAAALLFLLSPLLKAKQGAGLSEAGLPSTPENCCTRSNSPQPT